MHDLRKMNPCSTKISDHLKEFNLKKKLSKLFQHCDIRIRKNHTKKLTNSKQKIKI